MNWIEPDRVRQLVDKLLDEHMLPLSEQRRDAGQQSYFPLAGEPGATTYYEVPTTAELGPGDFEFPGGGRAEGLLDALTEYWTAEGEIALADCVPLFKLIAKSLQETAAESAGDVSIFCYTMF